MDILPAPVDPVLKPGFTTSEWWGTVINTAVQEIVTLLTVIHPGFHEPKLVPVLIPMIAQTAAVAGWAFYAHGRAKVKAAVASNPPPPPPSFSYEPPAPVATTKARKRAGSVL